jgi:hypothetical protein
MADFEVQYDGSYTPPNSTHRTGGFAQPTSQISGEKYVDFENVFDPFERDADDVREFFDESDSTGLVDLDDMENPNRIFHDPKKVSVVGSLGVCPCACALGRVRTPLT